MINSNRIITTEITIINVRNDEKREKKFSRRFWSSIFCVIICSSVFTNRSKSFWIIWRWILLLSQPRRLSYPRNYFSSQARQKISQQLQGFHQTGSIFLCSKLRRFHNFNIGLTLQQRSYYKPTRLLLTFEASWKPLKNDYKLLYIVDCIYQVRDSIRWRIS
jgi:hypothetical protein